MDSKPNRKELLLEAFDQLSESNQRKVYMYIDALERIQQSDEEVQRRLSQDGLHRCLFCGKSNAEVETLIVTDKGNICNECIDKLKELISKKKL